MWDISKYLETLRIAWKFKGKWLKVSTMPSFRNVFLILKVLDWIFAGRHIKGVQIIGLEKCCPPVRVTTWVWGEIFFGGICPRTHLKLFPSIFWEVIYNLTLYWSAIHTDPQKAFKASLTTRNWFLKTDFEIISEHYKHFYSLIQNIYSLLIHEM